MQEIIQGDCLEIMKNYPNNHFTGILTDPPYGLHFMGKDWDSFKKTEKSEITKYKFVKDFHYPEGRWKKKIGANNTEAGGYDDHRNDEFEDFVYQFGLEAMRILKPGGHILMFGAPRRFHRQVCGLEDAGFEIRDCLSWLFGQGFPKSHNHFGLPGYGTALKPAWEPIIVAMKPIEGTFAQNAEKWGLAGINIDACRIHTQDNLNGGAYSKNGRHQSMIGDDRCGAALGMFQEGKKPKKEYHNPEGRWPANLILDVESAALLDQQSGNSKSSDFKNNDKKLYGDVYQWSGSPRHKRSGGHNDYGGASRFFYTAKASPRERNAGLEGMPLKETNRYNAGIGESINPKAPAKDYNHHPTVKPISLMEYLLKLIAPPANPLILDPFAGSGTTVCAAAKLDIPCVGIEKEAEYCEIARKRIEHWKKQPVQYELFA